MLESPKQQKHSSSKQIPALAEAYQIHLDLIKTINVMDIKIQQVIRTHEAQFLLAYRNHIKTMKQQLMLIKQRAEDQQRKMMSNQRSVFLEEALRLYDKLQQKTQQSETNKSNNRELQKLKAILQKQNKQQAKQIKTLQTNLCLIQSHIQQLKAQNKNIKHQHHAQRQKIKAQLSKGATNNTNIDTQAFLNKASTPKRQSFNMPKSLNSRKGSQNIQYKEGGSKLMMLKQRKKSSIQILDHQLKNHFLQCLQTIRKQVAQRKVYGYKSQDINVIGSWQQFRMIDKLRLLEMFMQNQKLLVWMYQKIFPSRISEIQNYFSAKKNFSTLDYREKSKSVQIHIDDIALASPLDLTQPNRQQDLFSEEAGLPKVVRLEKKQKSKKYDVRNRIEMKSGKLTLKHLTGNIGD